MIALVPEGLGTGWMSRLIDLGADDVLSETGEDQLAFALKKAERAISGRRRMQDIVTRLENDWNLLQAAIDNLPSPIFFKNREGIYCGCNRAFSHYIGLSQEEITGASVYDVAPEHLAKVYEEADEKLMCEGGAQFYEAQVRYATGELRHVSFHKAVTRDRVTGKVNGLAGAMLDITKRKELEEKLQRAADIDHLTGAYNRRKFFRVVSEVEATREADSNLSVLVIDVDNFKSINDEYGHAVGDGALCHLVGLLERQLDAERVFARAGGEEFFVLLPDCELAEAAAIAETIRWNVENSTFECAGMSLSYRISVGVATLEPNETVSSAIIRADKALYQAKRVGRNRVFVA